MKTFVADSNYHQFYVADRVAEPDAPDIWTDDDVAAHHVTLTNISALSPESDIDAKIISCGPNDEPLSFPDPIDYEVRVTIECPSRSVGIYGWPWELEDEYEIGATSCDILFRAFLTDFKDEEKDYYYVHVTPTKMANKSCEATGDNVPSSIGACPAGASTSNVAINMNRIRCKLCDNMILPTTAAVTGGLCMPCKNPKPKIVVDPNDPVEQFRMVKIAAFELMVRLESKEEVIEDSEIIDTYFSLERRIQSNCDSVAQGLLVVMASLCAHRRDLTSKLLPSAIAPVYALGFEGYEAFAQYLRWLADFDIPYLGTPTRSGRSYLLELSTSETIIREAIRYVWQSMRREPPEEDEYVPHILRFSGSEQAAPFNR